MSKVQLRKDNVLYPELSYQVIGCAYDVFNELGVGHHEKFYQRALAVSFKSKGIEFREQLYIPVKFQNTVVGRNFLDFLVEGKIVVELKKDSRFSKQHIDNVLEYLIAGKYKLAILINFTREGVVYKRLVNNHDI